MRPSKLRGCGVIGGKNGGGTIDFNLEVLCSYIENEGRRRRKENDCDEEKYLESMQEDKAKVSVKRNSKLFKILVTL